MFGVLDNGETQMKLTINKPQNGYQGWTGFITDAAGKRHAVGAELQAAFNTREALVRYAKWEARVIKAGHDRLARQVAAIRQGATGPLA